MKFNLLEEVIKNEVYPAFGCTEPISVAYATASATSLFKTINLSNLLAEINLDPATYKNGYAVPLPIPGNYKGNLIAAAIGIIKPKPHLKGKIFENVSILEIKKAAELLKRGNIKINVDYTKKDLYIEAIIKNLKSTATCIVSKNHFNILLLSYNGKIIKKQQIIKDKNYDYRDLLKNLSIEELINIVENKTTKGILSYIEEGIKINLKAAKKGMKLKKFSYFLKKLNKYKIYRNNLISKLQIIITSATDARMAGIRIPIMSSGQSGNQGIVTILTPYLIGKEFKIKKEKILKSIVLSHLINSYIKSYTGELSTMCGCSVSSAAAASSAIVYMFNGDATKITNVVNNVISEIGGIICDGAKESCSLKVATAVETSVRLSFMSLEGFFVDTMNGFLGKDFKQTIINTARMALSGMSHVDAVNIEIMKNKSKNDV
ncbi:MAG: L-serine ammonia-lyase, iron-sulfur-dependent, subunit alpha [Elusimicrobiales bacterium]|nr:L-serine ammonia-lyase, iron-sulfur-dependent, subunit alpha [Elusimicrobiales bacterium]